MAIQLGHERLAEAHDFRIALAAGVEVGTALCAAHRQGGQAVFEGLLESKEFHNREVYRGMEPQAALEGTDCAVELDAISTVDLDFARVVGPGDTERNNPLRLDHALEQASLLILRMFVDNRGQRGENFLYGLLEFGLRRMVLLDFFENSFNILAHDNQPPKYSLCVLYRELHKLHNST